MPVKSLRGAAWKKLADLGQPLADEIEAFFTNYPERQGRKVEVIGQVGPQAALRLVEKSLRGRRQR